MVDYQQPVTTAEVQAALDKGGIEHSLVASLGGTREVSVRFQPDRVDEGRSRQGQPRQGGQCRYAALTATRPDATVKRRDYVGSQVGDELRSDGIIAVLVVMLGIDVYLGIRFEWRFAVAAIVTEFHDTLITVGVFALVQRDFDLTVLASVLAVIGYSINDKVVVFDRVRELFRLARKAEPEEILNRSINNTLSRTIITALFTAITMAALYFIGGPVVHGFAHHDADRHPGRHAVVDLRRQPHPVVARRLEAGPDAEDQGKPGTRAPSISATRLC